MKKIKTSFKNFIADESAQGATEYILLLVAVVAVGFIFKDQIKSIVTEKLEEIKGKIGGLDFE